MREQEEIVEYIKQLQRENNIFFGVVKMELICYLSYEYAKPYLRKNVTREEWEPNRRVLTNEAIIKQIVEYMPFAWRMANDTRGISANRSIYHIRVWLWLLNDGSLEKMDAIEYEHYGKEKLMFVCEHIGIDWRKYDDGIRING